MKEDTSSTPHDKQWLEECCHLVKQKMPDNYTFVVFAFPHRGSDRMYYASNATRESAVAALKEWLKQSEKNYLKHIE